MRSKFLILGALLFSSVGLCAPETKDVFSIFKSICLDKNVNWIIKGEEIALKHNWEKNIKEWGKKYGVRTPDAPTEPELFDVRSWTFLDEKGVKNKISIWMVAADWPMLKANSCSLDRLAKDAKGIKTHIEAFAGKEYVDDAKFSEGSHRWVFENTMKGNFGKLHLVMLGEGKMRNEWHTMISVIKWDLPSDRFGMPHQNPFP
jgi:hypothetical protein